MANDKHYANEDNMNEQHITLLKRWLDSHIGEGKLFADNVSLANKAGLSEGTIRRIRSGEDTTKRTFNRLAAAFNLKPSELEGELEKLDRTSTDEEKTELRIRQLVNVLMRIPDAEMEGIIEGLYDLRDLPREERETVLRMIRALREQKQ